MPRSPPGRSSNSADQRFSFHASFFFEPWQYNCGTSFFFLRRRRTQAILRELIRSTQASSGRASCVTLQNRLVHTPCGVHEPLHGLGNHFVIRLSEACSMISKQSILGFCSSKNMTISYDVVGIIHIHTPTN
jgi:hypothetical protein